MTGGRIVTVSWAATVAFGVLAGAGTVWPAAAWVATTTAVALFAAALGVWAWAMLVAVARSAAGEDLAVGSLFLAQGQVDRRVRAHLWGSLAVCSAVTVAVAARQPFAVLVPMLPAGLVGLWGARHGRYPRRRGAPATTGPLRPRRGPSENRGRRRARDRH